jgi:hypothetical protein
MQRYLEPSFAEFDQGVVSHFIHVLGLLVGMRRADISAKYVVETKRTY